MLEHVFRVLWCNLYDTSHRRPKLMKPSGMIFPEPMPVTDDRFFRDALGRFATGITVITCRDPGTGQPQGFTANSFSSLSLDPPLVLFSLRREAQCLPAFLGSGAFAVNVLAHDQMEVSARFASSDPDRWAGIEHAVWSTGRRSCRRCWPALNAVPWRPMMAATMSFSSVRCWRCRRPGRHRRCCIFAAPIRH